MLISESASDKAFFGWLNKPSNQRYRFESNYRIGLSGKNGLYSVTWMIVLYAGKIGLWLQKRETRWLKVSFEEFLASSEVPEEIRKSIIFNLDMFLQND